MGGGPSLAFLAKGTLDPSGTQARIEVQSIQTGNLPGFVPLGGLVTFISEEAKTLQLGVTVTAVTFTDGEVMLQGQHLKIGALCHNDRCAVQK